MATIGLFGGSFNPLHIAHQMVALYVLETCSVDELWMMPTYRHAFAKELVAFDDRVRMCELASQALGPRAKVSRIEEELAAGQPATHVNRTLDTLQALHARHPELSFRLIVGADLLAESHKWYRWDDICALAPPIVVGRSGGRSGHGDLDVEMPAISSTQVRERIARGDSVAALVPRGVLRYIGERGLYK